MKVKQLQAFQSEFVESRRRKVQDLHSIWDPVLEEYGMNGFSEMVEFIREHKLLTADTAQSATGRVASLNVLCRKMMAMVAMRNPAFLLDGDDPRDEPIAAVLESGFKQVLEATQWADESGEVVFDAVLYGTGVAKIGYGSEFVYDEQAWSAPMDKQSKALLSDDEKVMPYGITTEYTNFRVKEGMPMMQHVSARDIFFNLGVRHRKDIRRIYHVHRRPLSDVLQDSRYDGMAKRQAHVVDEASVDNRWLYLDAYAQETSYVECVECLDLASRKFCVFTSQSMRPLVDWTDFPFPIEKSIYMFSPMPMDGTVWGIPYSLLILGQAKAINRHRAAVIDGVNRDGKTIIIADGQRYTADEVQTLQNMRDREWYLSDRYEAGDPGFYSHTLPSINPDVMMLGNMLQEDMNWVSGLTEQTRNSNQGSDETATSAQLRNEAQNLTVEEFRSRYERFQEQMAGGLAKIMLSRWDPEKLIKVVGPNENIFFWTKVNLERVIGNFTLKIVAESTQKRDRATQRKQWTELLPRIGEIYNYIMAEQQSGMQGPVDWHEVLRETFDQYDSTLARRILRPQNTAQLVIRLMEQQLATPRGLSPQLIAQVKQIQALAAQEQQGGALPAAGQEGLPSGVGAGGFEEARGIPAPQSIQPQGQAALSEMAGMVGRPAAVGI